ncbi:MAG TPA: metallophosphoesterase [Longimicrobiaceae bacterium]
MRSIPGSLLALALAALAAQGCRRGNQPADAGLPDDTVKLPNPADVYGVSASQNVAVTPVEIEVPDLPPGWSGMKIAALSDFQLGLWADNEKVALAATQKAAATGADLFVLLGDYVARGDDYAAIDRVLAPLKGRRVMAVLGTADETEDTQGNPDSARIKTVEALERSGVKVLRDIVTPFAHGGDTAWVAGLEPYLARRADWKQAEVFNNLPDGPHTMLALAHMPVTALSAPNGKFPVILSGHTFCGQVEVPGTPRLAWFNTQVLPGTPDPAKTRIWRVRGSTLFATCGLGYSYVPVRFGHPPEVALITLRAVGPAPANADSAKAAQQANVDSLIQVFQQRDTSAKSGEDSAKGAP